MRVVSLQAIVAAVFAVLTVPGPVLLAQEILLDGFEPGSPSSWSSAIGWSCPDGDAPVPGNSLIEEAGDPGCPPGMDLVASFCMDRYEASLAVLPDTLEGGGLAPWSSYLKPSVGLQVRALSVRTATPQGYIDQQTAAAACQNSAKRLCTDAEWLRACRGPSSWSYPWGNSAEPGRCNTARAMHPLVEYYGTSEPWIWEHLDQPCLNQLPGGLERAGNRPACASAEGPFDLYGNLLEWTDDPAGTARGGDYVDASINGPGCLNAVTAHDTNHFAFNLGFRCCADPE